MRIRSLIVGVLGLALSDTSALATSEQVDLTSNQGYILQLKVAAGCDLFRRSSVYEILHELGADDTRIHLVGNHRHRSATFTHQEKVVNISCPLTPEAGPIGFLMSRHDQDYLPAATWSDRDLLVDEGRTGFQTDFFDRGDVGAEFEPVYQKQHVLGATLLVSWLGLGDLHIDPWIAAKQTALCRRIGYDESISDHPDVLAQVEHFPDGRGHQIAVRVNLLWQVTLACLYDKDDQFDQAVTFFRRINTPGEPPDEITRVSHAGIVFSFTDFGLDETYRLGRNAPRTAQFVNDKHATMLAVIALALDVDLSVSDEQTSPCLHCLPLPTLSPGVMLDFSDSPWGPLDIDALIDNLVMQTADGTPYRLGDGPPDLP